VGHIGCGRIARAHDMPGVLHSGLAEQVAVCDLDSKRATEGKAVLEALYRREKVSVPDISVYNNYKELIARDDIDAVVISTPDHWHAELALAATLAGKDVYLQKPMTMTHAEGVIVRDASIKAGNIFQVGSQQRSWQQFREASQLVRSGRVGTVRAVEIGLPVDPTKPDDPEQPVPANLNYDMWLGCTPDVYYTEQRVHPNEDYDRPGWLRNESYCLGMITGWGSHHYDTMHWALDVEDSGPGRVSGTAEFPTNKIWNVHGPYEIHLTYPGDIHVTVSDKLPNGLKFIGDDGWIFVSRDTQTTADGTRLQKLEASDPRLLDQTNLSVRLPGSDSHHKNWLQCVQSRETPLAPAPIAHRSGSACIVSWIAMKLGRELTWDANAERFVNDDEANSMLSRPERGSYGATQMSKA
jgi:predicted dehydrogenase